MPALRSRLLAVAAAALAVTGALATPAAPTAPAQAASSDGALAYAVGKLMTDPTVRAASVGVEVRHADTGTAVYSRNPNLALIPASDTKIFTSIAAMGRLGPTFRFHTDVYGTVSSGSLATAYLKGFGDPTTLSSDYDALAKQLVAKGVRSVGRVVADTSYFEATQYSPYWKTDYFNDYYAALCSPLTAAPDTDYDAGNVVVSAIPTAAGSPARITFQPAEAASIFTVSGSVRTSAAGTANTMSAARPSMGSSVYNVSGQVPVGTVAKQWITVPSPALYAAAIFRERLRANGILVPSGGLNGLVRGTTPAATPLLARDWSMTVSQLLVPFLKLSNNTHAEALTKTMAAVATGQPGSWAVGTSLVKGWASSMGVNMTGATFVDGSGLTRGNKVTASQLAQILVAVQRQPWFTTWYDALPIAGMPNRMVGGTLAKRMLGTAAVGNVHAKNGLLSGVTSLSGYATGADGRRWVFAMVTNYTGTTTRAVENALGIRLASWR